MSVTDEGTAMDEKTLLRIARPACPNLETLQERRRDCLDFHEAHVLGLKRAIEAAYELGLRDSANRQKPKA